MEAALSDKSSFQRDACINLGQENTGMFFLGILPALGKELFFLPVLGRLK